MLEAKIEESVKADSRRESNSGHLAPLGVDRKILSIRREPMLSAFSRSQCLELLPLVGIRKI